MHFIDVKKAQIPIAFAILAAMCYGVSAPFSKILLDEIPPTQLAALLYLGAGLGMVLVNLFQRGEQKEARVTREDLPYTIGMIVLDIAAPILLMFGLTMTTSANAALLNNFEIVATSLIALFIFKEAIGKRMWIAIACITLASMILSFEDIGSFSFSFGSLLVLAACLCWGLENNCTRMLSLKNPIQIVILKGLGAGGGALLIVLATTGFVNHALYNVYALLLGFFAFGLSIFFYIKAQRDLGAARTSAYYAIAPFVGAALSFLIFRDSITILFAIALLIMIVGAYLAAFEKHTHFHIHDMVEHDHRHSHESLHHNHQHEEEIEGEEHNHLHVHTPTTHEHEHTPDTHHSHFH